MKKQDFTKRNIKHITERIEELETRLQTQRVFNRIKALRDKLEGLKQN